MAKRNKVKKTQVAVSNTVKSTPSDKVSSALSAVDNLIDNDNTSMFSAMADKFKSAKSSHDAADEAQKQKVSASLEDDIQALVGELKKSLETNKKLELENRQSVLRSKQLEESVEELKKKTEADKKDHEKSSKELAVSQKKLSDEQADIANRLSSLKEQELDAESGFSQKHMAMLDKFEDDKEKLLEGFNNRKANIEGQIKELRASRESLSEEESNLLDEKLKELSKKEEVLADKELELKQEKNLNDRKLRQSQLTSEEAARYKISLRDEVETEYVFQVSTLENQKQNLEQQISSYQESESQLLSQLSSFSDIKRQFGDSTPQQVLEQLSSYKTKVNDLSLKLDEQPSEQIEAQFKELKKAHEALDQEYKNTQTEFQKNKTQLNRNRMSVIDLEEIEKRRRCVETHNEFLKVAQAQLRADVDDLVNKQQSKTAFPALLELDNKLRATGLTENVPSLNSFAKELQQRIAWDARENKALYYRLEDIQLFIAGLSMSRLHILQGISGTGKTSLAKAFARAVGGGCMTISVQAGWRDKGDLVGHFNAFEKKFYEQETLQGLYEAQCPAYSDRPYIVLLDEMNLSRPEQYFAEFLSALELDPKDRVLPLMTTGQINGPELLIDGRKIKIPENVWFIGTANHDETTYEFADKTYDRAHVMELPRHTEKFEINKNLDSVTYSFSSLEKAFESASIKHKDKVSELIKAMDESMFSDCLEQDFNVSWGNRLERHLVRFIPVMLECGSDVGFALDHMLATKVLRAGKATGRYDTKHEDISNLIDALDDFWASQNFQSKPEACLKLLKNELKKAKSNI
jgi:MoxR-like ATPase